MEIQCQFCDAPATVKCMDCKKCNILCSECFGFKHKNDASKAHMSVPLSAPGSCPQTSTINFCVCKEHKLERKYICKTCEITICSDCFVDSHKFHDIIKFAGAQTHIEERFGKQLNDQKEALGNMVKVRSEIQERKGKLADSFGKCKKMIEKHFTNLRMQIADSEDKITKNITEKFTNSQEKYSKLEADLLKIENEIKETQEMLNRTFELTKTADGYDKLKEIKLPEIIDIKNSISKNNEIMQKMPDFMNENLGKLEKSLKMINDSIFNDEIDEKYAETINQMKNLKEKLTQIMKSFENAANFMNINISKIAEKIKTCESKVRKLNEYNNAKFICSKCLIKSKTKMTKCETCNLEACQICMKAHLCEITFEKGDDKFMNVSKSGKELHLFSKNKGNIVMARANQQFVKGISKFVVKTLKMENCSYHCFGLCKLSTFEKEKNNSIGADAIRKNYLRGVVRLKNGTACFSEKMSGNDNGIQENGEMKFTVDKINNIVTIEGNGTNLKSNLDPNEAYVFVSICGNCCDYETIISLQ